MAEVRTSRVGKVGLGLLFLIIAVVLFLVAAFLVLTDTGTNKTQTLLTLFGLASFVAGHIFWEA
jgi:hypothetical protein